MSSEIKRIEINVFGRVQKVFFRNSATRKAKGLNLNGWVKNEPDGSVKIVAEGEEENLNKLIDWSKRGSLLAKVDKIEVKWEEGKNEFDKFEIRT